MKELLTNRFWYIYSFRLGGVWCKYFSFFLCCGYSLDAPLRVLSTNSIHFRWEIRKISVCLECKMCLKQSYDFMRKIHVHAQHWLISAFTTRYFGIFLQFCWDGRLVDPDIDQTFHCLYKSTLITSKSKGLSDIFSDISTLDIIDLQNWGKITRTTTFHKWICDLTSQVRYILKIYCGKDITKTWLCNFDPLKAHFYIVKLGFTGVYIIFLFLLKNIDGGYSLEPPRRGGSNEYP